MFVACLLLSFSLALLVWSANRFVKAAAMLARLLDISPFVIGVLLVGFGTSLPEMLVSTFAAINDKPEIALGNVYGSNITNIALILGLVGFLRPIPLTRANFRRDLPILFGVMLLSAVLIYDSFLARIDALMLLGGFIAVMIYTVTRQRRQLIDEVESDRDLWSGKRAVFWVIMGLLLLIASSEILVRNAVIIAHELGVSELLIGLTIVALGTSLPELSAAVAAARQGENEMVMGNILGSILFNTLIVVGIAGSISPLAVAPEILKRDFPLMLLLTLALFACSGRWMGKINRPIGAFFLFSYLAYNTYLFVTSVKLVK